MKNKLKNRAEIIDTALRGYVYKKDNPQSVIYEAMEYSLLAGGKRLRPVLMIEVCNMVGGNCEEVMPFACAMEMIHTYSLIHDDLPAMDNDDLRRGRPTNHVVYGEAKAILAGDALLTKAFEVAASYKGAYSDRAIRAISMLAQSAGTDGMIGGQIVDLESEDRDISASELKYLHSLKTGAIIRSSCTIGALMGGAGEDEIKAVDEFALNLGIAFQIRDDILDVTGNEEELGKPIGSDEEEHKNTYVKLFGIERSEELVEEYSNRAKAALECFGEKAEFLLELTDYLISRRS